MVNEQQNEQSEPKVLSSRATRREKWTRKITWRRISIKQKFQQRHQQASPTAWSNCQVKIV